MRRPTLNRVRRFRGRRARAIGSVLLLIPLLVGMLGTPLVSTGDDLSQALAQQKALQAKIQAQKHQVALLSAQQAGLSATIAKTARTLGGINANLSDVRKQVSTLAANVALVRASYGDLVSQLKDIDAQLASLQAEETRRQLALIDQKNLLAQRVRDAYSTGQTTLLETLLSSGSFADALSQMGYYLDMGTQDQALADQIAQDVRDLDALHQAVLGVRADTEDLRDQVKAQKVLLDAQLVDLKSAQAKLKDLQAQAQAQLDSEQSAYNTLAHNKQSLAAAIRKATAAKAALKKKIERLTAAQAGQGNIPSAFSGSLQWPMAGSVSQEFGCTGVVFEPPLGNCSHFHQGIDVVAPYGTPIHAAGDGVVVYIGWNYADGYDPAWIVIIAHASNLQTWYAHMQPTYPVHQGDHVSAGQVIGYEGSTGHSTGAHLHWAVMLNGSFVNPRLFL